MTGVVTLSFELELGWGMHDQGEYGHLYSNRSAETKALHRLLDLADRHDLPTTFEVVGHLFHDSCSGSHPGPHPKSWWTEDPGIVSDTDLIFYAPDLVREIRDRRTKHELATHTYSHLLADEATSQELDDELATVDDLHDDAGLPAPTSIVMPRHQQPDYSILADHGIETIRRPIEGYGRSDSNHVSTFWWLLTRAHSASVLERRNGILETTVRAHPSLTAANLPAGQSRPHSAFSAMPESIRKRRHCQYLLDAVDKAKKEASLVHFCTHLYNFAKEVQWNALKPGLDRFGKLYGDEEIDMIPMRDLPDL